MAIKKGLIKKQINKMIAKQKKRNPVVIRIKSVAILNRPASNLSIKKLELLEKKLHLDSTDFHIFTVKNKKDNFNELRGLVADAADLNMFGTIKNQQIKDFLNRKYDLLIDFTGHKTDLEKFFSLKIQAGFRVGYTSDDEIFDLMIDNKTDNIDLFIKEMTFYLELIGLFKNN